MVQDVASRSNKVSKVSMCVIVCEDEDYNQRQYPLCESLFKEVIEKSSSAGSKAEGCFGKGDGDEVRVERQVVEGFPPRDSKLTPELFHASVEEQKVQEPRIYNFRLVSNSERISCLKSTQVTCIASLSRTRDIKRGVYIWSAGAFFRR